MATDNINAVARALVEKAPKEMDMDRMFSFGQQSNAKNFIGEGLGAPSLSFTISNETAKDVSIIIGHPTVNIYGLTKLKEVLGADTVLNDGVIYSDGVENVTVTCNDPGRNVASLINYSSLTPLRFVAASFDSAKVDGGVDTLNYSGQIKSAWISPFQKPVENFLPLRKYNNNKSTSVQFVDINFISEGFMAMISSEHFLVLTVKAGTTLTQTWTIGAQLSLPQLAFRAYNKADGILGKLR